MPLARCSGPGCSVRIDRTAPSPDFCSSACASGWLDDTYPTVTPAPGPAGYWAGALWGCVGVDRNNGLRPRGYAFDWLDARPQEAA